MAPAPREQRQSSHVAICFHLGTRLSRRGGRQPLGWPARADPETLGLGEGLGGGRWKLAPAGASTAWESAQTAVRPPSLSTASSSQLAGRGGRCRGGGGRGRPAWQGGAAAESPSPAGRAGPGRAGAAVLWHPRVRRAPRGPSVGQEVGACAEEPGSPWLCGARPARRLGGLPGERPGFLRPSWTPAAP